MILVREPNSTIDQAALIYRVIEACRNVIAHHETHLCDLDRAIGDGDHGTNMRRGLEALAAESRQLTAMPVSEAMIAVGTVLVMSIGGAAGPLYGTLLLEIGKGLAAEPSPVKFPDVFQHSVAAVARRGKSSPGEKTMLDVLYPVSEALISDVPLPDLAEKAQGFADTTVDMKAMRGRASFLGERSIGHMDPGAASCALLCKTVCHELAKAGAA
jgi:dihydroxyacetone kinase-like protein